MKTSIKFGVAAAALTAALWGAPAYAGEAYYGDIGGANFNVRTTTLQELKFKNTIRQQYDFSCGSAAVATLLSHHYGRRVSETDVFKEMWEAGDQEKIRTLGFSMLDMQKYLERRGLRANGYKSEIDRLFKAKIPAIALIDTHGYKHFVVVKGINGNRILMSDPSVGTKVMEREAFEKAWNQVLFVVLDEAEQAQASFNRAEEWAALPKAPVRLAQETRQGLAGFLLAFPGRNHF